MYIPASNREDDLPTLHHLIQHYSFATLVTSPDGVPFASPLPFLLDTERGPYGALRSHMARANPQWHGFRSGLEALVIFQGPHAYLSPAWYATHPSVPTWNYAMVHIYGAPRVTDDADTYAILRDTVAQYESPRPKPWTMDQLPSDYTEKMQRAVIGFEIEITRLEGKFKLSQNKSEADRTGAIAGLIESDDPLAHELAVWMQRAMP